MTNEKDFSYMQPKLCKMHIKVCIGIIIWFIKPIGDRDKIIYSKEDTILPCQR